LPARAHRHFLLAASAAPRSNPPETSTNPRAQPLSNAIDHCSAKKTEPAPCDRKFNAIVLLQHIIASAPSAQLHSSKNPPIFCASPRGHPASI
jgi:hypothetical protein